MYLRQNVFISLILTFSITVWLGCFGDVCAPGAQCTCIDGSSGRLTCRSPKEAGVCSCSRTEKLYPDAASKDVVHIKPDVNEYKTETKFEKVVHSEKNKSLDSFPDKKQTIEGTSFFRKIAGLWIGAASRTPLGTFAITTMDIRQASPYVLFSRADLDASNNLRFAFSIETHKGKSGIVFRNGGYFLGILRDSRTFLEEYNAAAHKWRFCSVTRGCSYIESTFTFPAKDQMVLSVTVRGREHMFWQAERREVRVLSQPFPQDLRSQGEGDAPFPKMSKLKMSLTWSQPLTKKASVWFLLSSGKCGVTFTCQPSRSIRVEVQPGATQAEVTLEQLHVGAYFMNALLDRNNNAHTTFFPDSGDGIGSLDQTIEVKLNQANRVRSSVFFTMP